MNFRKIDKPSINKQNYMRLLESQFIRFDAYEMDVLLFVSEYKPMLKAYEVAVGHWMQRTKNNILKTIYSQMEKECFCKFDAFSEIKSHLRKSLI